MRAFIGIDFSSKLKGEISALQKDLRSYATAGRWKYADNFHLTLKFLESVNEEQLNEINLVMKELCRKHDSFRLNISEIGNFKGNGCIRVLWLGLDGELNRLKKLQSNIEDSLQPVGFEKEMREYRPHVTIGQDLSFKISFDEIKRIAASSRFEEIEVDRVFLFKSEQIGNKRVYTPIKEYLLK